MDVGHRDERTPQSGRPDFVGKSAGKAGGNPPTAFGLGFEHTIPEWKFGPSPNAFGHNGSGGSLGLVDPDVGLSLGYVMNRLYWGKTRDDPRWDRLFDAIYSAL